MSNTSVLAGLRSRWNGSLFRVLGRRVRARVDIEDLAQETYLRLLRTRDLTDVHSPESYLLRVASHVITEWREKQLRPENLVPLEDNDLLVDDSSPEFELEALISQRRLEQVLAAVSPKMRAVLLLRLRDQRSYKDIADDLHITVRQVRRYLARGTERLRTAVED
jgi:RNA polymerase sigma-70 factor (ECF subfamily)